MKLIGLSEDDERSMERRIGRGRAPMKSPGKIRRILARLITKANDEKVAPFDPSGEIIFGEKADRPKVVPTKLPVEYWIDPLDDESLDDSSDDSLRCSFCGKAQHQVTNLIAGPSVHICDGCVDVCGDIILQESSSRVIIKVKTRANSMFDDALYDSISILVAEKYPEFDFQYETRTFDRSSSREELYSNVAIFSMAKIYSAGYGSDQPIAEAEYNRIKEELAESIASLSVITQKFLHESDRNRSITNDLMVLKGEYLDYLRKHGAMTEPASDLRAVLFLDISGFSAFDYGYKTKVVDMLRGITPPLLSDRGAGEVNMWGDAIVGTFSDPNQAIESAIKFLRHLAVERLEARIGMAWGRIRISHNVATGRSDIDGPIVDFAARLEQMAPLGEILLSREFLGLEIDPSIGELVPDKVQAKKAFGSYATGDMIDVCRFKVKMN